MHRFTGEGINIVKITTYNATGQLVNAGRDAFTLGTRVLLTCNVTRIIEGNEVVSYRWFRTCTGVPNRGCEIRDEDPYYRVVNDTLLVDITNWEQGGKYSCFVMFSTSPLSSVATPSITVAGWCSRKTMSNIAPYTIALHTGNPAPFLYTPTSLLPEHSVLTDVQQATGRNGQQWITCRSGGQGTRPQIWMGKELVASNSTNNTVTIGLNTQIPNGLYHCLSDHSERKYFSLFLRNPGMCMHHICSLSEHTVKIMCMYVRTYIHIQLLGILYIHKSKCGKVCFNPTPKHYTIDCFGALFLCSIVTLPAPNVESFWDNITWTLTLPDDSRVERYIVEFECRVRNMTFIEKYMSVNASGGTGQVTSVQHWFAQQMDSAGKKVGGVRYVLFVIKIVECSALYLQYC